MTTIPVNYIPSKESIELDRSREFWLSEKYADQDMTGYREEDI